MQYYMRYCLSTFVSRMNVHGMCVRTDLVGEAGAHVLLAVDLALGVEVPPLAELVDKIVHLEHRLNMHDMGILSPRTWGTDRLKEVRIVKMDLIIVVTSNLLRFVRDDREAHVPNAAIVVHVHHMESEGCTNE